MAIAARAKRYVFLVHRWTGIAMCILMAAWFISGIVMLFIGYPKLTPWERLGALPALGHNCCLAAEAALSHSDAPQDVKGISLTSIRNQPHYVLQEGRGGYTVVNALDGQAVTAIGPQQAMEEVQAFMAGAAGRYIGTLHEDRWTRARSLNPHRPLHIVEMQDEASTRLYVSSSTGQVVLDAPRAERLWNFAGAWLHWLYMFRNRPSDPVWTWTVIILSGIGVVTACSGLLNGIWRLRLRRTYKNGSRTPYHESYMRWHHLLGLLFGGILFLWIFSGLMSMNPLGIFSPKGARPDIAAYQGGNPGTLRPSLSMHEALALLKEEGFAPSELEWRVLNGKPYMLARDSAANTRIIALSDAQFAVMERWPEQELMTAAQSALPSRIVSHQVLEQYDTYYYKREAASMYGANERRLPALRVVYDDPGQTWMHIDVHTGQIELSTDRSQRIGRWLFNFLHSWDLPTMLLSGWMREAALIMLSMGGILLSLTAVVIGARRLRKRLLKKRAVFQ